MENRLGINNIDKLRKTIIPASQLYTASILYTFFFKSDLELLSLRICLFIFSFSCDFAFNALFYFNDKISKTFDLFALKDGLKSEIWDLYALFIEETKKLKIGNPLDKDTDLGPVIDENAAINIEESVNNAIKDGADLLYGGKRDNCFFEPTILDNVDMSMDLVANETFGPIAPLIRVNGVDEAIKVANDTQYGLQAGVFTENINTALRCANEIVAGAVLINKASSFRADNMPFGGFKSSGMGKEGIKYAVEDMCKTKLIAFRQI